MPSNVPMNRLDGLADNSNVLTSLSTYMKIRVRRKVRSDRSSTENPGFVKDIGEKSYIRASETMLFLRTYMTSHASDH